MLAQPAGGERRDHLCRQRVVPGVEHLAAIDAELNEDAILLEIGALDVEPHAVGEPNFPDAERGVPAVADNCAGGTE